MQQRQNRQPLYYLFGCVTLIVICIAISNKATYNDCTSEQLSVGNNQFLGNSFTLIHNYDQSQRLRQVSIIKNNLPIGYFKTFYDEKYFLTDLTDNTLWNTDYDYSKKLWTSVPCGDTTQYQVSKTDTFEYVGNVNMLKIRTYFHISRTNKMANYIMSINSSGFDPFKAENITLYQGKETDIIGTIRRDSVTGYWLVNNNKPGEIPSVFLGLIGTSVGYRYHDKHV